MLGAFAPLASFALFHLVTVFPLSWVFLFTRESPVRFLIIEIGRRRVRRRRRSSPPASSPTASAGAALLGGSAVADRASTAASRRSCSTAARSARPSTCWSASCCSGLSFGQSSGAITSNFQQTYRYTASALTSDLAWLFGAGFAPLVALLLATNSASSPSGAYLLSGAFCTLLALWLSGQREAGDMDAGESSN